MAAQSNGTNTEVNELCGESFDRISSPQHTVSSASLAAANAKKSLRGKSQQKSKANKAGPNYSLYRKLAFRA